MSKVAIFFCVTFVVMVTVAVADASNDAQPVPNARPAPNAKPAAKPAPRPVAKPAPEPAAKPAPDGEMHIMPYPYPGDENAIYY